MRDVLRLEVGLLLGAAAVAVGVVLAALAVGIWGVRSFGHLDPQQSLRIVVPSTTLLIVGLQIMFSSCLLSILQLESQAPAATAPRMLTSKLAPSADPGAH